MTLRSLYLVPLACLLLMLPAMSGTAYSQPQQAITESDVLALVNAVDTASRKGNIPGMIAPLARDVKIKLSVTAPGSDQEHVVNLTKAQYASHTRQTMRRRLAYHLERKNTRIKIYDDNKTAMVSGDIYETLTIRQGTLRAVSSEVAILNLRNGKLLVTSIDWRMRLY
jgi:hypothetical protein